MTEFVLPLSSVSITWGTSPTFQQADFDSGKDNDMRAPLKGRVWDLPKRMPQAATAIVQNISPKGHGVAVGGPGSLKEVVFPGRGTLPPSFLEGCTDHFVVFHQRRLSIPGGCVLGVKELVGCVARLIGQTRSPDKTCGRLAENSSWLAPSMIK